MLDQKVCPRKLYTAPDTMARLPQYRSISLTPTTYCIVSLVHDFGKLIWRELDACIAHVESLSAAILHLFVWCHHT